MKHVQQNLDILDEANKCLQDMIKKDESKITKLKERNSKILTRLKEEAQRNKKYESEIEKLKRRLGDKVTESESD